MQAVANVLAKDPQLMARLEPLGIKTAADLAAIGPAIANVFEVADAIKSGNISDVIREFGEFGKSLPDGVRDKIIDSIADKFNLKPEFKELIKGALDAMSEPAVAQAIGDALKAFTSGNPGEFIKALANAGKTIADKAPGLAVTFLDVLGKLPGPVGKFFSDHELNEGIVYSGALSSFFDAVTKVANGDIGGAIGSLGDAIGLSLIHI